MQNAAVEMISLATIAIALFGVVFCLMQQQFQVVYRSFALFLVAVAANNLPAALAPLLDAERAMETHFIMTMIAVVSALCLALFFWIYVFVLTSNTQSRPAHLAAHLFLPACALATGTMLVFAVPDLWSIRLANDYVVPSGWPTALAVILKVLAFSIYPQLAFYIVLILRRLVRYRHQLRDVYASTEQHELNWIYVIGSLGVLFWLAQILNLTIALGFERTLLPSAIFPWVGFGLFTAATLWGLRQRPGLVPVDQLHETAVEALETAKYQKSALTADASVRIERKLRAAMDVAHLYRDPNLSLWVLARHVGASPNYISQTLNDVIGQNFFDFVNGYRIADATCRLVSTDESVLTITYDVGFNTRSSFYAAFKRVTGQTPVAYRKKMSEPTGPDDRTVHPRQT